MIRIQREPIRLAGLLRSVRRPDAGAIVAFLGTVRKDPGVRALHYEVYRPMALRKLQELVDGAKRKFGVLEMSIVHRVGRIPVGVDSVAIVCSAPHRKEAFDACRWTMEEVKRIVPIWKQGMGAGSRGPRVPGKRRKGTVK